MTVPQAAPVGEPRTDEQVLDEQAWDEERLRLRGRLLTAAAALIIGVLVGTVAILGGFERRTDLLTPVPIGSMITTGPYEITITKATVQHRTSSAEWAVFVSGTARTTGATSIRLPTGDDGFLFTRIIAGRPGQGSQSIGLGDTTAFQRQDTLTPGLPPVPWTATFVFDSSPADTVLVAVFEQEYTTPYLFSDEEGWRSTRKASTMTLPVERLPDSTY